MRSRKWSLAVVIAATSLGSLVATPAQATGMKAEQAVIGPAVEPLSHGTCTSWRRSSLPDGLHRRVPSIGSGTTHCVLRRGNRGSAVRALQVALANCNGRPYRDALDGAFGPLTEAAVRAVQDRENVTIDGIYGPQTRSYMFWPAYNASGRLVGECYSSNSFP